MFCYASKAFLGVLSALRERSERARKRFKEFLMFFVRRCLYVSVAKKGFLVYRG